MFVAHAGVPVAVSGFLGWVAGRELGHCGAAVVRRGVRNRTPETPLLYAFSVGREAAVSKRRFSGSRTASRACRLAILRYGE
jgi:hypothetical protein